MENGFNVLPSLPELPQTLKPLTLQSLLLKIAEIDDPPQLFLTTPPRESSSED